MRKKQNENQSKHRLSIDQYNSLEALNFKNVNRVINKV